MDIEINLDQLPYIMIGSVSLSFKIIDFSGTMDFEEYIMAINCTNFTEPKDKLTWMFNCFDEVSIIYYLLNYSSSHTPHSTFITWGDITTSA